MRQHFSHPNPKISSLANSPKDMALLAVFALALVLLGNSEMIIHFSPDGSFTTTTWYLFYDSIHDLLALGIALYAAYRWTSRIGEIFVLFFVIMHAPYFYLTFPIQVADHLMRIFEVMLALGGIRLIARLKNALGLAHERLEMAHVAEKHSQYQATHDHITGLPNRLLLGERTQQAVAVAQRTASQIVCMFIDLDHFKDVNDSLGHEVGDKVLKIIGERINGAIRESDTVGRIGGDEFGIVASSIEDPTTAAILAERVKDAVNQQMVFDGHRVSLTCSIGLAMFPSEEQSKASRHDVMAVTDELLSQSDISAYRAKKQGGDSFQFFDPSMAESTSARLSMLADLRDAVDNDELVLHYQPLIDVRSGAVFGAEALVRWNRPNVGMVPPLDFIPLAESSGLIVPIGEWVIRTACKQAKEWSDSELGPIVISVNLSAIQIRRSDMYATIRSALDEADCPPSLIDLELTESVLMQDTEKVIEMLRALRAMGMTISIDDFGTGYSSLAYLQNFPVDTLKIDRSFINSIATGSDEEAIARAILNLGHTLGMHVLAEGVENIAQAEQLKTLTCDRAQGFLFSRPLKATEFEVLPLVTQSSKMRKNKTAGGPLSATVLPAESVKQL